jgi:hypothetical protein
LAGGRDAFGNSGPDRHRQPVESLFQKQPLLAGEPGKVGQTSAALIASPATRPVTMRRGDLTRARIDLAMQPQQHGYFGF